MSKLSELMEEMCTDGVEYKRLGDIATITRGGNFQKRDFVSDGRPCIHYGQIHTYYGVHTHETLSMVSPEIFSKSRQAQPGDIVMATTSEDVKGVCKCVAWLGNEPAAVSGHTAIIHHSQNPRYLAYFFQSETFQVQKKRLAYGVKVVEVKPADLGDVLVPVPPLEVQAEIVRILDKFTEYIDLITRELSARRKQYEYYRDKLLTFSEDTQRIPITELFTLRNGYTPSKRNPQYWQNGFVSWFRMDDIRTNGRILSDALQHVTPEAVKGELFPANSLIISTSATIGEHALITTDFLANQRFTVLTLNEDYRERVSMKFMFYCCYELAKYCRKYTHKGSFESVDMDKFRTFCFPVPTLDRQNYIVRVLDRFESLTSSLTQGLPAEIQARRKQYEYYRDKLLTFRARED